MEIPLFLAISQQEMASSAPLPAKCAWLGCHFSENSAELTNLSSDLPEDSFLIVDDSVPVEGHDSTRVLGQINQILSEFPCRGVLLDFQRPPQECSVRMVKAIVQGLPCPVGVSEPYAQGLDCPVFLPPIPVNCPPEVHLQPWIGQEIWLDVSYCPTKITLTPGGCKAEPTPFLDYPLPHRDDRLCCHYSITTDENQIVFSLQRTPEDVCTLLKKCAAHGVTHAFGLYQELAEFVR